MSDPTLKPKHRQSPRSVTILGSDTTELQCKYESAPDFSTVDRPPVEAPSEVAKLSETLPPPPPPAPGSVTQPVQLGPGECENLKFHSLCELFPLLNDADLEALADDIKLNGVREPITLIWEEGEWRILDGRNRFRAIIRHLDLSYLSFVAFSGGRQAALAFVMSRNFMRRHLTEDQRAAIAVEYYRQLPRRSHGGDRKSSLPIGKLDPSASAVKQAVIKQAKISAKQFDRANAIAHKSPELAKEVAAGTKKLVKAEAELKPAKPREEPVSRSKADPLEDQDLLLATALLGNQLGEISLETYVQIHPEESPRETAEIHQKLMAQYLAAEKGGAAGYLRQAADSVVRGLNRLRGEFGLPSTVPEIEAGIIQTERELRVIAERLASYAEAIAQARKGAA
jgi:hypothetical protein